MCLGIMKNCLKSRKIYYAYWSLHKLTDHSGECDKFIVLTIMYNCQYFLFSVINAYITL